MSKLTRLLPYIIGTIRNKIPSDIQTELLYMTIGTLLGLTIHQIGKAYVHHKNRRILPRPEWPTSRRGRTKRILDVINMIRAGELVTSNLLIQLLLRGLEGAASDMVAAAIVGMATGTAAFLGRKSDIILGATTAGLYSKALTHVHQGVPIIGSLAKAVCHKNDTYTAHNLLSDSSYEDKRRALKRYIKRTFSDSTNLEKKLWFVVCLFTLIGLLWTANRYGEAINLLELLHEAYIEGDITEEVYRGILRKLKRDSIPLDPDFWPKGPKGLPFEITTFKVNMGDLNDVIL
jgi:hypothetical protein